MSAYLETLIWTMLFVIFIELLFPESNIKKYLKLILGLVMVYAITSPMLNLFPEVKNGNVFTHSIVSYQEEADGAAETFSETGEPQHKLLSIYEKQTTKQIKQILERNIPEIMVQDIIIKTDEKQVDFCIEKVIVTAKIKPKKDDTDFLFSIGIGNKATSLVLHPELLESRVQETLFNFYRWKPTTIEVHVAS